MPEDATPDPLTGRWSDLASELRWAPSPAAAAGAEVLAAYGEAGRHYHGLAHLADVLRTIDRLAAATGEGPPSSAVRLAAWFHDVVYEPTRTDNEARSAERATAALAALGTQAALTAKVAELILATADHRPPPVPGAEMLLDADLAVLGASREKYASYAAAIRAEYAHLPDRAFAEGRAAVLRSLLARPRLYLSEPGRRWFEAAARANMTTELRRLGTG